MKVYFLIGPTAAGKSALAMELAEAWKCPIVNADSVQFYSRVQIGAAKPSAEELNRVPHHLVGIIPPPQTITAGDFRRLALQKLQELAAQGATKALVVGGSGFYLQALEKGMFDAGKVSEETRAQVESDSAKPGALLSFWEELQKADPLSAQKIEKGDSYRLKRAIEVLREFGKTPRQLQEEFTPEPFPYPLVKWGVNPGREVLREKVTLRTRKMIESGLVQEVRGLLQEGLENWAPLQSVGYAECVAHLKGEITLEEMERLIVQNTMRLAKRQMTWFRRDTDITWVDATQSATLTRQG